MQAVLVMIRSDGERRSFSIARDMTVIGRREDCDLRIPLGEISRKHCRLVRDEESLRVEDLGSSNGTYHNGERVQESVLAAGDTIQIGPVVFVLQLDGIPADEDLHPVASPGLETTESDMVANVTEAELPAEANADEVFASEGEEQVEYVQEEYVQEEEPVSEEPQVADEAYVEGTAGVDEVQLEDAEPEEEQHGEVQLEEIQHEEAPPDELQPEEVHDEVQLDDEPLVTDSHVKAPEEAHEVPHEMPSEEGGEHQPETEEFLTLESSDSESEELSLDHIESDHIDMDADAHHPH